MHADAAIATAPSPTDPTIFSRLERLDVMMGFLEEIVRGSGRVKYRSSFASTTSSCSDGGAAAAGGDSSVGSSPKSLEGRRCRPLGEAVREAQLKGPLIDRLHHLEDRVLKLSQQFEEGMDQSERKKEEEEIRSPREGKHHHHMKGIKSLVKSCVRGKHKTPKESKETKLCSDAAVSYN